MKKYFILSLGVVFCGLLLTSFTSKPQKEGDDKQIKFSDTVKMIAEKSCFPCHTSPGNKMAMMKLNLEKWNEYDAEKQEKKAGKMCSMVSKGAMPPKSFRTNNPDKVPTKNEIDAICRWAASVKEDK